MELKVLKLDQSLLSSMDPITYVNYLNDSASYSVLPFKTRQDPNNGWAVPFVTNHRYKVHWRFGIDFTQMQFDLSSRWTSTDKPIHFVHNFTDVRESIDFITGGEIVANGTFVTSQTTSANLTKQTGQNVVYNSTDKQTLEFYMDGKNKSRTSVKMVGYRCRLWCPGGVETLPIEDKVRRWSDPESWTNG